MSRRATLALTLTLAAIPLGAGAVPPAAQSERAKGLELLEDKEFAPAAEALERAVKLAPEFTEAWMDLGNARLGMAKYLEAAAAFEAALRLDPARHGALYNLAYSYRRGGQHTRARDAYRAYLAKQPNDADAYYALAESLRALDDKGGAADAYDRYAANEKRPDRQTWVDQARKTAAELRSSGAPAAAAPAGAAAAPLAAGAPAPAGSASAAPESALGAEAATDTSRRTPEIDRGLAKLRARDFAGARVDLEASAQGSNDPWVWAALASAELGSGDASRASEHYRRALSAAAPKAVPAIRFGLAEALRAQHELSAARETYRAVIDDAQATAELKRLAGERLEALARAR
ncbi:MAG: tetratricopeptide repeat protein [Deltaproteobacteria bacterium]|nr:tetratricopeptide repeat protein [Deltaproteobacteria bacterium]